MSASNRRSAGICAVATILCLGILYSDLSPLLKLAGAGPLIFYLPGWAVMLALEAKANGMLASATLRVSLSLAIIVIVGLLLHLADSITSVGWLSALGIITIAACLMSLARRDGADVKRVESNPARARGASCRFIDIALLGSALGVTAGAVALSFVLTTQHHEFYYTQLWIISKPNAPDQVIVGLRNDEAASETYVVELLVDYHLAQSWSEVALKPGETWTTTFRWAGFGEYPRAVQPLRQSTTDQKVPKATVSQRVALGASPRVEALVYRSANRSVIYRHVWSSPQCATKGDDAHGRPPCES